jgi:heat shock protein HspQ
MRGAFFFVNLNNVWQLLPTMNETHCKFTIGQLIHHRRFDYRGVVYDVDATFQGSNDWYEQMAKSKPPKDQPWYHVLVHQSWQTTYVSERNLEEDTTEAPIVHPLTEQFFTGFENGCYLQSLS